MNKQDSVDKIIEILKKGALKFHDDFDKNLIFSLSYFVLSLLHKLNSDFLFIAMF